MRLEALLERETNEYLNWNNAYKNYLMNLENDLENNIFVKIYKSFTENNTLLNEIVQYENWTEIPQYMHEKVRRYIKVLLNNNLWPKYFWLQNYDSLNKFRIRICNMIYEYGNL